jgi:hypothetical protein
MQALRWAKQAQGEAKWRVAMFAVYQHFVKIIKNQFSQREPEISHYNSLSNHHCIEAKSPSKCDVDVVMRWCDGGGMAAAKV